MKEIAYSYRPYALTSRLHNNDAMLGVKSCRAARTCCAGRAHLPIVSGRYSNIPRNMRFCNLCNLQSLGDEFHYLFECPFFANDRNLFLKRYFIRRPNTFKMDQLFNSTHIKTILNLVKFCRKITKHFE